MFRTFAVLTTVLLTVSFLCLSAPGRAEDGAAALLAKHRAYAGWQFGDGTFGYLTLAGRRTDAKSGSARVIGT